MRRAGDIKVQVRTLAGSEHAFMMDPSECLASIQDQLSLEKPEFYHNGRRVSKFLSLSFQNLTENDELSVMAVSTGRRKQSRRARFRKSPYEIWLDHKRERKLESARLDDIIWGVWETSVHHNKMVSIMMSRLDETVQKRDETDIPVAMNICPPNEISESPLPTWFKTD